MHPGRKFTIGRLGWAVSALAGLALVAAACSGGSGAGPYGAAPSSSSGTDAAVAVVDLRGSQLGQTLVDGQGRTLYLFEADKVGKSNCDGACASAWPPYLSGGAPKAGAGVTSGLLGTIPRGGGAQVTYHGHPLYYYVGDNGPGDAAGEGLDQFGAKWFVVGPNGSKVGGD